MSEPRVSRRLGLSLCVTIAVIGVTASAVVFELSRKIETQRIRDLLEIEVEERAGLIAHRLRDGMLPIAALGVSIASQAEPSSTLFNSFSAKVSGLGFPISLVAWNPRVADADRSAFEAAARAEGLQDYTIMGVTPAGTLTPASRREEYFPIRFEYRPATFPSSLGFDIGSDPLRRRAIDEARDRGTPIALLPALSLSVLRSKPTYILFWPVYHGDATPLTIELRRRLLAGYIAAIVRVSDMLVYALDRDPTTDTGLQATIDFTVSDTLIDGAEAVHASYRPHEGVVLTSLPADEADASAIRFERGWSFLGQHWVVHFRYPARTLASLRSDLPWTSAGLGLLLTGGFSIGLLSFVRRSHSDMSRNRLMRELMHTHERTNAELGAANLQLAERERAAAELARARTRFLASASHDLRQPLHALALFTSALQRRVSDPVGLEVVGNIQELTLSMQRMFNALLDLSRLDSGAIVAKIRPHDIEPLVATLLAEFAAETAEKGLRLRRAGSFPVVATDPVLLESVLRNLISNAVKFTDRGAILVAGRVRRSELRIEVWDTGTGIPADQTERIFEEFERLEETRDKAGFGLGLPIVRHLCELLGVSVDVCSRVGQGSRFRVTLPRTARVSASPVTAEELPEGTLAGRRVLLVDNDDDVQRALSIELEDLGCHVSAASNGDEALAMLQGWDPPDLVILDLNFGVGARDGLEIAAEIRAVLPEQKLVFLTGNTEASTFERIRHSGFPAMFKPVDPERMRQMMLSLLAPPAVKPDRG